ncbi:MAG: DMT family transporter [Proteobacteria bacterium]|nr:DMT family transporter [Pseudomonadota bacterium]
MASNEMPIGPSLFTAFLCILFGANAVAIKISLSGLGAFTTAGLRFGIAGVTILLWAIFKKQSLKANKKQIFQLLILSQLFVIQSSFFYIGLTQTAASQAVIINLMPFVVLIFAIILFQESALLLKKGWVSVLGFLVSCSFFLTATRCQAI